MQQTAIQAAIAHFEALQKRYTKQHNGTACEHVKMALIGLRMLDRAAQEPDRSGVDANRCEHQSDRCPHQYDLGVLMCCINHQGCADRQRKHMDAPARAEGEGGNG